MFITKTSNYKDIYNTRIVYIRTAQDSFMLELMLCVKSKPMNTCMHYSNRKI